MRKIIIVLLFTAVLLTLSSDRAAAWNQETHKQINYEALKVFHRQFSGEEKYRLGPIDPRGYEEKLRGIAVTSSSLFRSGSGVAEDYKIEEASFTMPLWIIYGGDWADEPHLYASVRHFYDPLKVSGVHYLTDQSWAHGLYDSPQIDARTWALNHEDNPFSFYQALSYYKQALETPETELPNQWLAREHFKVNLSLVPGDRKEQRNIYLALAYRALGETMHMMADMTQPAHVRNDSHPVDEPIENNIFSYDVKRISAAPVDWQIGHLIGAAGGKLLPPGELFYEVALFTNGNFYSMDTIYDGKEAPLPQNGQKPYPRPQFGDLLVEELSVRGWLGYRKVKKLYAPLVNDKISIAQERLSFHWFDPDQDTLEKVARAGSLGRYQIPPSFAKEQGRVLLPIAMHACADLMHLFFPTLELSAEYEIPEPEQGAGSEGASGSDGGLQVISISGEMVHRQVNDPAWLEAGLKIEYSGPGKLVFVKDGEVSKTRELHFLKGQVEKIETSGGEMKKEPLQVFVRLGDLPLTEHESFYEAETGSKLYLEISAGSRKFQSEPFLIKEREVKLRVEPTTAVGEPGAYFDFRALVSPPGSYRYDWDFGDGTTYKDGGAEKGHTYKGEGNFKVTVQLYDGKGKLVAEDSSSAVVAVGNLLDKMQACQFVQVLLQYDSHPEGIGNDWLTWMFEIEPVWSGNMFTYTKEEGTMAPGLHYRSVKVSGSFAADRNTLNMDYEMFERSSGTVDGKVENAYEEHVVRVSLRDMPFRESYDRPENNRTYVYFTAPIRPEHIIAFERGVEKLTPTFGLEKFPNNLDFSLKGEITVEFVGSL